CTTPQAMRTPVNAPGPRQKEMASRSVTPRPASASTSCTMPRTQAAWPRGSSAKRSMICPSTRMAAEQASVDVSRARILGTTIFHDFFGKILHIYHIPAGTASFVVLEGQVQLRIFGARVEGA